MGKLLFMVQVAGVPRKAEERKVTYRAVEQIERHKIPLHVVQPSVPSGILTLGILKK